MSQPSVLIDSIISNLFGILKNLLLPALISAIVSWYFGARWNDENQTRRLHTDVLKEKALIPLHANMSNHLMLKVRMNMTTGKYESWPLTNLGDLQYGSYLVSHLKTGYPTLYSEWESLKQSVFDQNMTTASFYDELVESLRAIAVDLGLEPVNSANGIDDPESFVNMQRYVPNLFDLFEEKVVWKKTWDHLKPKIESSSYQKSSFKIHWSGGRLVQDYDDDRVNKIIDKIERDFNDPVLVERYLANEKDLQETKLKINSFNNKLHKEIEAVHAGKRIAGRCDLCKGILIN